MSEVEAPDVETDELEPESPTESPRMVVPSHGNGLIRVGGTNKGGPGRPKNSIRQLARDHVPKVVRQLVKIVDGAPFLEVDGQKIPVRYTEITHAGKVLIELALGPDAIPEALIAACGRVLVNLEPIIGRPCSFTQDEMDAIGKALDVELGNAKVV